MSEIDAPSSLRSWLRARPSEPGRVDVVVPLYNEAPGIDRLVECLDRLYRLTVDSDRELCCLLVDDASTDDTLVRLRWAAFDRPWFRVLGCPERRGVGGAMKTGFRHSRGEVVVCYDADCTYPVEDVISLLDHLPGVDLVTASPLLGSKGMVGVPWARRLLTRCAAWTYRLTLFPSSAPVGLFTCAFRAYRREILCEILPDSEGFPAAAEMLCRAVLSGYRVREIPSPLRDREFGFSKMRVGQVMLGHLQVLSKVLVMRLTGEQRRKRRVAPVGEKSGLES